MSSPGTHRIRLKVRIGTRLSSEETALQATFRSRAVSVRSAEQDQPLKQASWLVFSASGFATESEGNEYGEELRSALHLAGLCTSVGVDGRTSGDDRTMSYFSPEGEDWLRSLGVLQSGERLGPDVHGLAVFPDDEALRFSAGKRPTGTSTHGPQEFINAIEESTTKGVSPKTQRAIRVLNLAQISDSPHAKVVLSISSIEALAAENLNWTATQADMLDRATDWVHGEFGDDAEASEVADAIKRMHRRSLRQQARRLLDKHGLMTWWKDCEDVYGRRSGLFHGGAGDDRDTDVFELAADAMKVCGRIVLSIAKQEGAGLPAEARLHFGVS